MVNQERYSNFMPIQLIYTKHFHRHESAHTKTCSRCPIKPVILGSSASPSCNSSDRKGAQVTEKEIPEGSCARIKWSCWGDLMRRWAGNKTNVKTVSERFKRRLYLCMSRSTPGFLTRLLRYLRVKPVKVHTQYFLLL